MGTPVVQFLRVAMQAGVRFLYPVAAQGSPVLLEGTLIKSLVHQARLGKGGVS